MVAVVQNNKGFSLVEMMIALVILMVSMLGLLSVMVSSINANVNNELRNAAIRLTNQTAEALLALPFNDTELTTGIADCPAAAPSGTSHSRSGTSTAQNLKGFPRTNQNLRGFQQTYNISWCVRDYTANIKLVTINVGCTYGTQTFSNEAVIYKHRSL